jgi:alkyl sulfatase BDS1-like metallo-beta-lactamase superfamily hydrolase
VAGFLSPEWILAGTALWSQSLAAPGPDASVLFALTGAPEGAEGYWWKVQDGLLADAGLGGLAEADVTFTLSYKDAISVAKAESDLNAGFMQGRVKVAGDSAKLFSVLALTSSPAYKAMVSELAAQTEFGG